MFNPRIPPMLNQVKIAVSIDLERCYLVSKLNATQSKHNIYFTYNPQPQNKLILMALSLFISSSSIWNLKLKV